MNGYQDTTTSKKVGFNFPNDVISIIPALKAYTLWEGEEESKGEGGRGEEKGE